MRPPIQDNLIDKPLSKQRKWAIRRGLDGKCMICGKPKVTAKHCEKHRKLHNKICNKSYHKNKNK